MTLTETKLQAKLALESLMAQCARELRNLERFEDSRQLVATYDLERRFNCAMESAEQLESAYGAQILCDGCGKTLPAECADKLCTSCAWTD